MTLATCLSDFYQETVFKDPCLNSITSSINHLDSVLPDLEDTEIDIQRHMGLDNFNLYTSDLEKALRSHKKSLVDALVGYVRKEFPEVIFNKNMLTRFAFHMKPFDAETFLNFIRKTYADQDLSQGARRHSEKTLSFRAGMKAQPRTIVNYSFSNS